MIGGDFQSTTIERSQRKRKLSWLGGVRKSAFFAVFARIQPQSSPVAASPPLSTVLLFSASGMRSTECCTTPAAPTKPSTQGAARCASSRGRLPIQRSASSRPPSRLAKTSVPIVSASAMWA